MQALGAVRKAAGFLAGLLLLLSGASCAALPEPGEQPLTILEHPGRIQKWQRAVQLLQRNHPGLEVVFLDNGGDADTWNSYAAGISAEIMSGGGPDLIMSPNATLSVGSNLSKLMKSGAFLSLNAFMEQQPEFREEAFNDPVIRSGSLNGVQYVMPLGYRIPCILTSREALEEAGIRPENCKTYLGFAREIDRCLASPNQTPLWVGEGEDYAPYFPACLGLNYADYETEQTDFSAPEWEPILEYYKRYNGQISFERRISRFTDGWDILSGASVFTMSGISSGASLIYHTGIVDSRMQAEWIPLPTVDGGCGAFVSESAAICANSPNRALAEELIGILLSSEIQGSFNKYSFPVRKECFARRYQQGNGDLIRDGYPPLDSHWEERLKDMAESIQTVYFSVADTQLFFEYLKPYFDGKRSSRSCLNDLENHYAIFLSE